MTTSRANRRGRVVHGVGVAAVASAALLLVAGGCATNSTCCASDCCKPDSAKSSEAGATGAANFTHTLKSDAEYYVDSPAQGRPPDGKLTAGTRVSLISEHGSYSRVQTADGVEGFVASASLQAK